MIQLTWIILPLCITRLRSSSFSFDAVWSLLDVSDSSWCLPSNCNLSLFCASERICVADKSEKSVLCIWKGLCCVSKWKVCSLHMKGFVLCIKVKSLFSASERICVAYQSEKSVLCIWKGLCCVSKWKVCSLHMKGFVLHIKVKKSVLCIWKDLCCLSKCKVCFLHLKGFVLRIKVKSLFSASERICVAYQSEKSVLCIWKDLYRVSKRGGFFKSWQNHTYIELHAKDKLMLLSPF